MSSYNILPKVKVIPKFFAVCLIQSPYAISSCSTVFIILIAVSRCQVVSVIVFSQVSECDSVFVHREGVAANEMTRRHCVPLSTFQAGCNISSIIYCLREGMFLMVILK